MFVQLSVKIIVFLKITPAPLYGIKTLRKVSLGVIRIETCTISTPFSSSSDNPINYFVDPDILFNKSFIAILKTIS